MEQDKLNNLKAEYAKEREICSGANASDYHKKRFAELSKKLGIAEKEAVKEEPKVEEPETVETPKETTEKLDVESVKVVDEKADENEIKDS